jgi:hypothetical protein
MKKIIIFASIFLLALTSKAQTAAGFCIQVNCPIVVQLPLTSAQLLGSATVTGDTVTSYKWTVTGPAGTLLTPAAASTTVTGLTAPGTYTFSLTATTKHGSIMTNPGSVVTVLAAPAVPPAPVVTGVSITLFGQTFTVPAGQGSTITISYNGTTQTVKF